MRGRGFIAAVAAAVALPLWAQTPAATGAAALEPAQQLVRDVIYNELHDRERDSYWEYRSARVTATQNIVREQVETADGPVFRVVAENGSALDAEEREKENQRLAAYVNDPAAIARAERAHLDDENHLAVAMQVLPQALLFEYEGSPTGDIARIAFRPNPAYVPSGYEARIVHALSGTVTVDLRMKRMIAMQGVLAQRVDFGYGLLGHVDQGGWFRIHRHQVSAKHWKTDLVDVHAQGKLLMLKTVSRNEREVRSDFHPVPAGTTPEQARAMLEDAAEPRVQADLAPVPAAQK
ncbi:MAG: hypothetical protein WCC14_11205 [Acidobacteriaceae bacterium]